MQLDYSCKADLNKMLFRALSVFGILVAGLCTAEKLHLSVPTCKRNASGYSTCLKHAIRKAWPLFIKGLPAEFNVPPLDPFFYEYQKGEVKSSELYGEISVSNLTIYGFADIRFKAVRPYFSEDAFLLQVDYHVPTNIEIQGICEAHGTFIGFQINLKVRCNITVEDTKGTWYISGPVKDDTWTIEHCLTFPTVKNIKLYIDNESEGTREMNNLVMMIGNEFWPAFYQIGVSIAAEGWDTYCSDLLTRLFAKLSFSEVFP